ncbi:MAG TPA: GNAT family protein [Gemmatimonadaceae bacterium]|nr:GNAT family protein [Gemmatimonadaceae bacterium]
MTPATWPIPLEPMTLPGSLVRLEPLTPDAAPHVVDDLNLAAADDAVWQYLSSDGRTPDAMRAYVADLVAQWMAGSALPFAVRFVAPSHALTGRVVGVTRLKEVVRAHRRLSIGSWLARDAWGTGANAEAKALLLAHAFEHLGAMRVEFETDVRNLRSRAALAALGAVEEGLLRAHRITRDHNRRDSVLFSVIDTDWPEVRARIAARVRAQAARSADEQSQRRSPND